MNPRSLLALHLPTLTEVVDEASIADHAGDPPPVPVVDLSDVPAMPAWRTPTPQEVERLRGDDSPFEATISDHQIRRALAEFEAHPVDVSLADAVVPRAPWSAEAPVVDTAALQARVLADVQRQVDALLEHRLRESLAPLLAQAADTLAAQAREVLASSLRELVAQAVAREIERQRAR